MFLGVVTYGVVRGVQYGAIHPATIVACFLAVHFLWIFVRIGRHAKKMQGVATGNAGGAEGRDDGAGYKHPGEHRILRGVQEAGIKPEQDRHQAEGQARRHKEREIAGVPREELPRQEIDAGELRRLLDGEKGGEQPGRRPKRRQGNLHAGHYEEKRRYKGVGHGAQAVLHRRRRRAAPEMAAHEQPEQEGGQHRLAGTQFSQVDEGQQDEKYVFYFRLDDLAGQRRVGEYAAREGPGESQESSRQDQENKGKEIRPEESGAERERR